MLIASTKPVFWYDWSLFSQNYCDWNVAVKSWKGMQKVWLTKSQIKSSKFSKLVSRLLTVINACQRYRSNWGRPPQNTKCILAKLANHPMLISWFVWLVLETGKCELFDDVQIGQQSNCPLSKVDKRAPPLVQWFACWFLWFVRFCYLRVNCLMCMSKADRQCASCSTESGFAEQQQKQQQQQKQKKKQKQQQKVTCGRGGSLFWSD